MSEIEMSPAQETVASWRDEDLFVFVATTGGCRYKAVIYPKGSILRIGAVLFLEEETVHCQAAGPHSIGTGSEKHTIRVVDPLDQECRLLERSDTLISYSLPGQQPEGYRLHEAGLARIERENNVIVKVTLA